MKFSIGDYVSIKREHSLSMETRRSVPSVGLTRVCNANVVRRSVGLSED